MAETDPRAHQHDQVARALVGLEPMVERTVRHVLDQVAAQYAASGLPALVAQGEPVDDSDARRIAELWAAALLVILLALLAVFGAAMKATRRALGIPEGTPSTPGEPGGRDDGEPDLVDIYLDRPLELPDAVRDYIAAAQNRLRDVGDTLWQAARQALADGIAAGETMEQPAHAAADDVRRGRRRTRHRPRPPHRLHRNARRVELGGAARRPLPAVQVEASVQVVVGDDGPEDARRAFPCGRAERAVGRVVPGRR